MLCPTLNCGTSWGIPREALWVPTVPACLPLVLQVNLHAMTAGVAMLSLYAWMVSLKQLVVQHGTGEPGGPPAP